MLFRSEFALSIKYEALPADVIASAKRVLLDTLGCAFGSVGSEPANIAETTIRKTFGEGNTATVIGYPRSATVEGALFVNGVLVRSLDLNDLYWHRATSSERSAADGDRALRGEWTNRPRSHRGGGRRL